MGTAAFPIEYMPSKSHSSGALLERVTVSTNKPRSLGEQATIMPSNPAITGGCSAFGRTLAKVSVKGAMSLFGSVKNVSTVPVFSIPNKLVSSVVLGVSSY
mmetsp:Transcript_33610/g.37162  ORF Transcript_33610/g.37162 Transcript_33610/m.37162 type:complete len:101 (-) Transcript_33610:595-897(-)